METNILFEDPPASVAVGVRGDYDYDDVHDCGYNYEDANDDGDDGNDGDGDDGDDERNHTSQA